MRQSLLFTKTLKEVPKDEISKNAQLLVRAGYVHKNMAGVYEFLPLGLRVMNKVASIVREEMDAIGGQELKMTVLQDPEPWQKSGRWDDDTVDNWFKTKLKNGGELGMGSTHEEPLAKLLTHHIHSYRDLPIYPYQIQVKFRNELRAKSGILRGREFLMKDLYSFSATEEDRARFYEIAKDAYMRVFKRVSIGHLVYQTKSSGGVFSKYSDEFQMISDAGEDTIYIDEKKKLAINREVYDDDSVFTETGLSKDKLVEKKAIEVGNIFPLGTKYSEAVGLLFEDENGDKKPVVMGSYGIGIARLVGAVVEAYADNKGIVWPENIAPFQAHVIVLSGGEEKAEELYGMLVDGGVEILLDDRDLQAGAKFADADLIGIPYRLVVSEKSIKDGGVEVKRRNESNTQVVAIEKVLALFSRQA
jgi:prolyl-tRNA synthetase